MIPIVTPAEMAAIDAAAPVPVAVLVERAGAAVARAAVDLLGGTYGRRVAVIAGKGNNGADGRAAATRLQRRGVRCVVLEPDIAALPVEFDAVVFNTEKCVSSLSATHNVRRSDSRTGMCLSTSSTCCDVSPAGRTSALRKSSPQRGSELQAGTSACGNAGCEVVGCCQRTGIGI